MLTLSDVAAILDMLGRDPDPQAAFLVFDQVVKRVLGHKLLTVMRHVAATAEVERIYSSNPRAYPVAGASTSRARRGASRCLTGARCSSPGTARNCARRSPTTS